MPASLPELDLLIVHQFDAAQSSPGGIDTCIRGIARYLDPSVRLGIIGVDATANRARPLGLWETHQFGDNQIHFMPVVRLDPAQQVRRLPHSLRLVAGLARFWRRIPKSGTQQGHRADVGAALRVMFRKPGNYFIHTQEGGLTGAASDSWWKRAGNFHLALERWIVKRSTKVVVFNEDYSREVAQWNSSAQFSPTWFDPAILAHGVQRDPETVLWVGRIEYPKDPMLALDTMVELWKRGGTHRLVMVGAGTLESEMIAAISALPPEQRERVELTGRLGPDAVAHRMAAAGVFLMTSRDGYEGFPRVLVEAMASGAVPVVTHGSDTGGLVNSATIGSSCERDAAELAEGILKAKNVDSALVSAAVHALSAPAVISAIYRQGR